jgi:N-methylhydantoinase A
MGLLLTDLRADFATTRLQLLGKAALPEIETAFATLRARAEAWFEHETIPWASRQLTRTIDMRYAGQNYELPVALPAGPVSAATLDLLAEQFAAAHQRMYGFVAEGEPVQLVTFRVEAVGLVRKAAFLPYPERGPDASAAISGRREVWLPEAGGFITCPVYDRDRLDAGNRISGPAIIEQMDATTVVLPGMVARVEPYLNLILEAA